MEQMPTYSRESFEDLEEKIKKKEDEKKRLESLRVDQIELAQEDASNFESSNNKKIASQKRLMNKILKSASNITKNEKGEDIGWLPISKVFNVVSSLDRKSYIVENNKFDSDSGTYGGQSSNQTGITIPKTTLIEIIEEMGKDNPEWFDDIKISGIYRRCYHQDLVMKVVEYIKNVDYVGKGNYLNLYRASDSLGVETHKILDYIKTHNTPNDQLSIRADGLFISKCFGPNLIEEMRRYFNEQK